MHVCKRGIFHINVTFLRLLCIGLARRWSCYGLELRLCTEHKVTYNRALCFAGLIYYYITTEHNVMSSAKTIGHFYKQRLIVNKGHYVLHLSPLYRLLP